MPSIRLASIACPSLVFRQLLGRLGYRMHAPGRRAKCLSGGFNIGIAPSTAKDYCRRCGPGDQGSYSIYAEAAFFLRPSLFGGNLNTSLGFRDVSSCMKDNS